MRVDHKKMVSLLGGQENLNTLKEVRSPMDWVAVCEAGFDFKVLDTFLRNTGIEESEIKVILNMSESTYSRRKKNNKLTQFESEKLVKFNEVFTKGVEVFEDEKRFIEWLHTKNTALGERKPIDVMESSIGTDEVMDILFRIEYGIYS